MELTVEEKNFVKVAKVILDVVPKYLRKCFVRLWNVAYEKERWQSNTASGEILHGKLSGKDKKDFRAKNLKGGNEEEWDTSTLVFALLNSELNLTEKCRPKNERTEILRVSEAIDEVRLARNAYFAHATNMSCDSDNFTSIMKRIRNAAMFLDDHSEAELDKIEHLQIGMRMTDQQMKQFEYEKSRQEELDRFFKGKCQYFLHRVFFVYGIELVDFCIKILFYPSFKNGYIFQLFTS